MSLNLHRDHRSRLKKRFLEEGLSHFEQHNILELLLFYAIPRRDTNSLAHLLLQHYGSLAGVLDASYESLMEIPGISAHSATLICLLPEIFQAYAAEKQLKEDVPCLGNITDYLRFLFESETRELVYAIYFDNREKMIRCDKIFGDDVGISAFMVRNLAEKCITLHASSFVLAHNHPNGETTPSQSDLYTTATLRDIFSKLQIPLIEHYIYADGKCYPLLERYRHALLREKNPGACSGR